MKKFFSSLPFLLLAVIFVSSCKKDDDKTNDPTPAGSSAVIVKFDHNWEGSAFGISEDSTYINSANGDSISFTKMRYYISNVKLKRADGSFYIQPNSYFLIDSEDPSSLSMNLGNVPSGQYTDLYFTFGVDSLHNVSGAQDGVLSPDHQMFWTWSTGYIMLKAEGISPDSQTGGFAFHLGGFSGVNSVVHERHFDLTNAGSLSASSGSPKTIHIDVPVNALWNDIPSLATFSNVMSTGAHSKDMAISFTTAMSVNHIE